MTVTFAPGLLKKMLSEGHLDEPLVFGDFEPVIGLSGTVEVFPCNTLMKLSRLLKGECSDEEDSTTDDEDNDGPFQNITVNVASVNNQEEKEEALPDPLDTHTAATIAKQNDEVGSQLIEHMNQQLDKKGDGENETIPPLAVKISRLEQDLHEIKEMLRNVSMGNLPTNNFDGGPLHHHAPYMAYPPQHSIIKDPNLTAEWPHPYTRRWTKYCFPYSNDLRFETFDGRGNPELHLKRFVISCGEYGTHDGYLLQRFSLSLKGPAFDWYVTLDKDSIDSWDHMKKAFLKDFHSIEPETTLVDLISIKQNADESPLDYIDRWRAKLRTCKERIQHNLAVDMCKSGLQPTIGIKLVTADIQTFSELSDKVKRIMTIKELYGERLFEEDGDQGSSSSRSNTRSTPLLRIVETHHTRRNPPNANRKGKSRKGPLTFEEATSRPYSFPKDCVEELFNSLLQAGRIILPRLKRPEEEHMTSHPMFCPYHRMVGHVIEDCIPFKNILERMIQSNELEINGAIRVSPPKPHEASSQVKRKIISINVTTLHGSVQSVEEVEERALPAANEDEASLGTSKLFSNMCLSERTLSVRDLVIIGREHLKNSQTYFEIYEAANDIAQCAKRMLRRIEMRESLMPQSAEKESSHPKIEQEDQQRKQSHFQKAMSRSYSFPRELVKGFFNSMVEAEAISIPKAKRPNEAHFTNHPSFCPYHQILGHTIEDCMTFKNVLERMIQNNEVEIHDSIRIYPPEPHSTPREGRTKARTTAKLSRK